jgi:glutamate synthase (NADPH/NADH) small chain
MKRGYDVEGAEFTIGCDSIILATGQTVQNSFALRASPSGLIAFDQANFKTSCEGVFAGGDVVLGGGTAAKAVGMGKLAAQKISEYVLGKK